MMAIAWAEDYKPNLEFAPADETPDPFTLERIDPETWRERFEELTGKAA